MAHYNPSPHPTPTAEAAATAATATSVAAAAASPSTVSEQHLHHQHIHSDHNQQQQQEMIQTFWNTQMHQLENVELDFKTHPLPLARIKKVMKTDPDVKMISAEAPLIFSKACEIFIAELTVRAWLHAEENKRRTLQRSDIAMATRDSDQYDFLIDIVPRDDGKAKRNATTATTSATAAHAVGIGVVKEEVRQQGSYYPPEGHFSLSTDTPTDATNTAGIPHAQPQPFPNS